MFKIISKYLILMALLFQVVPFCKSMISEKVEETDFLVDSPLEGLPLEIQSEILRHTIEIAYRGCGTLSELKIELYNLYNINRTAYKLLRSNPLQKLIKTLIAKKYVESDPSKAAKELINRVQQGNVDWVKFLIIGGVNVNAKRDDNGSTALICAAYSGNSKIVELLIEADPNLDLQNNCGDTALMAAFFKGDLKIVKILLRVGVNVNVPDVTNTTALMTAVAGGHKKIVKKLLCLGADINLQNQFGNTALMIANIVGCVEIAELLDESCKRGKDGSGGVQKN